MNEIYVLITGEYSDWEIQGFVESEEEAIKTCELYNENRDYDRMYYEHASRFKEFSPEKLEQIKRKYNYTIRAWRSENSWHFQEANQIDIEPTKEWVNEKREVNLCEPIMFNNWDPYAVITLTLTTVDREKALKIAQDMLYKKLAEREGL